MKLNESSRVSKIQNQDMDYSEAENEMPVDQGIDKAMAAAQNLRKDVDDVYSVCEKFCKYYYEMLQKKPHLVGQLYVDSAVLIWDGNPTVTSECIQKFFEQMPSFTFNLTSMDCQSINGITQYGNAVGNKRSFIIKLAGQLRVSVVGTVKPFTQELVITVDNNKWRIASDNFRTQS